MGSIVNGLGSYNPATLIHSLTASAPSATPAVETNVVTAKQELAAMQKNGDLSSMLSANIAVGVLQLADPSSAMAAGTDMSALVHQLISAYVDSTGAPASNTSTQSAATLPANPALAIIQSLENAGAFAPILTDPNSVAALGQTEG